MPIGYCPRIRKSDSRQPQSQILDRRRKSDSRQAHHTGDFHSKFPHFYMGSVNFLFLSHKWSLVTSQNPVACTRRSLSELCPMAPI